MKTKTTIPTCIRSLGMPVCLALLASLPATALAVNDCMKTTLNNKPVEIHVDDEGEPYFEGKACNKTNSKAGDICYGLKERAGMRFRLAGTNSLDWTFEGIELSTSPSVFPSPNALPLGAYSDFEFDTDDGLQKARPYVDLSSNDRNMRVRNNNCHAFTVYYQVLLRDPGGNPVTLHPIIENSGTGQ